MNSTLASASLRVSLADLIVYVDIRVEDIAESTKLSISFDQNDVDGVTNMRVTWTGVPVGQEEVTKRNWGEYYVRSIKKTFG